MPKKKSNKIPSYDECHDLDAWHTPWNKDKYKSRCNNKKCIWEKSAMGSRCKDPISVTNENIQFHNLNNNIYLATLTVSDLKQKLKYCNMVNDKYLKSLIIDYTKKRLNILKDIVTLNKNNYLIHCSSNELFNIVLNAKSEKIKKMKTFDELLEKKRHQQEMCFNSQLGNNRLRYENKFWFTIADTLNNCGIDKNDSLYKLARNNWETYNVDQDVVVKKIHVHKHVDRRTRRRSKNRSRSKVRNKSMPIGNWINTARNYKIIGNTLYAELKNRNGFYVKASANLNLCKNFENDNGHFKCVRKSHGRRSHGRKSHGRKSHGRKSHHKHIHIHKVPSKKKSSRKKGIFTKMRDDHNKMFPNMNKF